MLDRYAPELPPTSFAGTGLSGLEFEGLDDDDTGACPAGIGVIDTERGDGGNMFIGGPGGIPECGGGRGGVPGEPKVLLFLECKGCGCEVAIREPGLPIGGLIIPSSQESFRRGEFDANGDGSTRSYPIDTEGG